MKGFIKISALDDGGLCCECELKGVGVVEKAGIIAAMFQGLEIGFSDMDQVATYIALAKMMDETGTKIRVDKGVAATLKKMADEKRNEDG